MSETKREAWKTAVATLVSVAVTGFLAWLVGALPAIYRWICWAIASAWEWLNTSTPILGWLIVLGTALATVGAARIASAWRRKAAVPDAQPRPEWESFRSLLYRGALWQWEWIDGRVARPQSFCPRDMMQLQFIDDRGGPVGYQHCWRLFCQKCRTKFDGAWHRTDGPDQEITFEIDRLVRTGEWRDAVKAG